MKTYTAQRPADDHVGDCRVFVTDEAGNTTRLHHVVYHSPTGLEWGYGGSGPADTALSILADHFSEYPGWVDDPFKTRAWHHHQQFKWAWIAPADRSGFTITGEQIRAWIWEQDHHP